MFPPLGNCYIGDCRYFTIYLLLLPELLCACDCVCRCACVCVHVCVCVCVCAHVVGCGGMVGNKPYEDSVLKV